MKKTLASLLIVVMVFCMLGTMFVTAEDESLTWEDTLGYADDGNAYVEVPYGYTWYIDDVNGTIGGEDATICTTQDAYNACNPNWAITIYAAKQADGTYVAQKDAIVTPGSAAGAGITIGEGQIAIVVHSSSSNPDSGYANWQAKVVAVSVKAGDIFEVAEDFSTVTAIGPGGTVEPEEPVDPDAPNTGDDDPEVPGETVSGNIVAGMEYEISEQFHMGGADVGWGYDPNAPASYPDDNFELTNGLIPGGVYSDAGWMGFNQQTPAQKERGYAYVNFDLGKVCKLAEVKFVALKDTAPGITCPYQAEVWVSNDGTNYESAGVLSLSTETVEGLSDSTAHKFNIPVDTSAQYVQLRFISYGWCFLGEIEMYSEVQPDEPEEPVVEGNVINVSHVNYYSWGAYNEMLVVGEGLNSTNCPTLGQGCQWWIAIKVDNVDGIYTVTQIEGNGEEKVMTASADGFILYCFENDAASYAAAQNIAVGDVLLNADFDWTVPVASATAIGTLTFGEATVYTEVEVNVIKGILF